MGLGGDFFLLLPGDFFFPFSHLPDLFFFLHLPFFGGKPARAGAQEWGVAWTLDPEWGVAWTLDPEWGVAWTLDPELGVAWTLDLVDSTRALTLSAARLRFFLPRFAARAHHPPLPLLSPSSIEN